MTGETALCLSATTLRAGPSTLSVDTIRSAQFDCECRREVVLAIQLTEADYCAVLRDVAGQDPAGIGKVAMLGAVVLGTVSGLLVRRLDLPGSVYDVRPFAVKASP